MRYIKFLSLGFVLIFSLSLLPSLNTVSARFCSTEELKDCTIEESVPDMTCVLSKLLNTPNDGEVDCCENKCPNTKDVDPGIINNEYYSLKIFNTNIEISYEKLPTLINLGFSTFLAIIAIYAAIRGIYIFAIKMPNATQDDQLASISKEARALVIGFILSLSFLFITQLVFSILGLPSLADLQLSVNPENPIEQGPVIIIN